MNQHHATADVYDLVIVGGSFAGLAAAAAAASRGLRTLVIDRKPAADASVRTTGILVKEAADEWDVPHELLRRVPGVRLYAPSGRFIDLHRPGYAFYATDTPRLMRWFAERAATFGAELRWNAPLRDISRNGGAWSINQAIKGRYLIAADGARSKTAQLLGLGRNRSFLTGVELEYTGVRGIDPAHLHVWIDRHLAPGYIAWAAPGTGGITQIGLAVKQGCTQQLERFDQKLHALFDFSDAEVVGGRGGLIPVGGPVRRMGMDGVTLIGDAAGMVSPLTAGGIHLALHYGRAAGIAVADHLLDGGPDPATVVQRQRPGLLFKRMMRWAMDVGVPNHVVDAVMESRLSRAIAQSVFYHHRGVFSAQTWADVARLAMRSE